LRAEEPLVGVVVLNWNRALDTIACLESLEALMYGNTHVIVVDNGSTNGSPATIGEAAPDTELLTARQNLGFAAGVNMGIYRALELGAEYVLLLNNDVVVAPDFLGLLQEAGHGEPRIGITVPKIFYYDHPTRIWSAGARWRAFPPRVTMIALGREDDPKYSEPRDLDYATGCALLVHRRVFEAVGTFDTAYFMYQEDYDFCRRARQAGFRIVYVPQAKVWHKVSRGLGENSHRKWYLWSRSAVVFYGKHFSNITLGCFLAWIALRETAKGNLGFFPPFVRGARDGMKALAQ
jgi:GT2 family glycosyltransferase